MSILIITREESEAKVEYVGLAKSIIKKQLSRIEHAVSEEAMAEVKAIHVIPTTILATTSIDTILSNLSINLDNVNKILVEDDVILSAVNTSLLPPVVRTRHNLSSRSEDIAVKHSGLIFQQLISLLSGCASAIPVIFGEAANMFLLGEGTYTDAVPSVDLYTTGVYGTNIKHNNGHPVNIMLDKSKLKSIVFSKPSDVVVHSSGSLNGVTKDLVNSEVELPMDLFIPLLTTRILKSTLGVSNSVGACMFSNIIPLKGENSNISVITKLI